MSKTQTKNVSQNLVELSSEELVLLNQLREGKLTPPPVNTTKKSLSKEELQTLIQMEMQIKDLTSEVGVTYERITLLTNNLIEIKNAKAMYTRDLALKYGIPTQEGGWEIDMMTGEISQENVNGVSSITG